MNLSGWVFRSAYHTELIALRVGQHGPGFGACLPDVHPARSQRQQALDSWSRSEAAVAGCLARFKGPRRVHAPSGLCCYLSWWAAGTVLVAGAWGV